MSNPQKSEAQHERVDHAQKAAIILGNIRPDEIADDETANWFAWAQVHASLALVHLQRETYEDQKETNAMLLNQMAEVAEVAREGWAAYHRLAAMVTRPDEENNA